MEVGYPAILPRSDLTHQTSPTTTNRSKSLPTDPIQLLRWLDAHWNTPQTLETTFPNELWKERFGWKSCPSAQNRYWVRHFHKWNGHAELDFCGSTSISNAFEKFRRLRNVCSSVFALAQPGWLIYIYSYHDSFPGGCDLADFRKCAFGAIIMQ